MSSPPPPPFPRPSTTAASAPSSPARTSITASAPDSPGPEPSSPSGQGSPPLINHRDRTRSKVSRGASESQLVDVESPSRRSSGAAPAGRPASGSIASSKKLQKLAGAAPSGRHNLREVRCEGWLHKKNHTGLTGMRGWTRRFFVLFPHSLCYWATDKDAQSKPPRGKFDCSKIVRVVQDENKSTERFDVFCNDGRIIELKANTPEDAAFWVESLPGEKSTAASNSKSMQEIMSELAKNQPDDSELNKQFEAFMEEKCFKPDARARMRLLPSTQKWLLLCQEQVKGGGSRQKGPEHWLRLLRAPKVQPKDIESLKVAISGSGKSWMNGFVQIGGLAALLALLSRDTAAGGIAQLSLDCLKAFMNNEFGLNVMLSTPHAIEQIALVLTFGDEPMCTQVIDLLLVTCWLSEDGHKSVMDALDNPRFQKRFRVFTEFLARGENSQFKAKVLSFINALINALNALDERIYTRTEFIDLGMIDIIEKLRAWVDKNRGSPSFETFDQIRTQCDIFEEEMTNDKREATQNGLDLSDMDAVLAFMRENFQNSGQSAHFLTALHHLMLVPSDKHLGGKMWNHVNHILDHATKLIENEEADEEEDAYHLLTIERLKELLTEREKQSLIEEKNQLREMEKEAEQLRTNLHNLHMKEQQYQDEIRSLKAQLASALQNPGSGIPAVPGDGVPVAPGFDVPSAPPLFGDVPVPPPFGDVPVPPPFGDIPVPPPFGDIPMPPPFGDVPMPPPFFGGDVPMPPPFDGVPGAPAFAPSLPGFGPPVESGPKLPKKKVIKPEAKMKALHWNTIAPKEVADTCWKDMDDEHVFNKFDKKDFELQFQAMKETKKAPKKEGGDDDKKEDEKKSDTVNLLDPKRSYNISISLARFRMGYGKIRDAVLQMDRAILDEEKLLTLINCAPTTEEVDQIMGYEGDENLLGEPEKFFKCLSTVPRIKERLELFLFEQKWQQIQEETEVSIGLCERSLKALKNSKHLKKIMEIILAFGNYLNGGTKKGQAYGFKLDTLNKIKNTKSTVDSNLTLLHFLVDTLHNHFPDTIKFLHDLKDLPAASRVELNFLTSEVNKVNANLRKLERELKGQPAGSNDRFNSVMSEFHTRLSATAKSMQDRLTKVEQDAKDVALHFGEDPKSMPMEELFQTFSTFVQDFQKAMVYLEKRKEQEEKNRRRQEAEEARRKKRDPESSSQEEAGREALEAAKSKKDEPIVDKVVGALTGPASGIRQMIRARRRKAGAVRRKGAGDDDDDGDDGDEKSPLQSTTSLGGGAKVERASPMVVASSLGAKASSSSSSSAPASSPLPSSSGASSSGASSSGASSSASSASAAAAAAAAASGEDDGKKGGKKSSTTKKKKKVWQKHADPDSGDVYYYNTKTGVSTWELPPNFPYD